MRTKDILLIVLMVLIWGASFLLTKIALLEVSPMVLGTIRYFLVVVPLVFFVPKPKVSWFLLLLYGVFISFIQFALFFTAIKLGLPTGLSALILQTQAFFTVIIFWLLWKDPLKHNQALAILFAIVGLALLGIGIHDAHVTSFLGLLLGILAALSWTLGNVLVRKIGHVNAIGLVTWGNIISCILFALLSLYLYGADQIWYEVSHMSLHAWLVVIYLAYLASVAGFGIWGDLLSRYPASKIAPLALFVPVVALILGYVIFHEALNFWQWSGVIVVIVGLIIHIFGWSWMKLSRQ